MRIGLILYGSLDNLSGGYLYDRKLVEGLRQAGDQVEILSLPYRNYAGHLSDNFSPTRLKTLKRSLQDFDLLLQDELNHPSLFLLNRRLRDSTNLPILSIVHHLRSSEARPAWQNRLYRVIERLYLSSVDGFIFNSRTTCNEVAKVLRRQGTPSGAMSGAGNTRSASSALVHSIIAYPAANHLQPEISEAAITGRACQPGPLKVLFVGALIPRKGVHTLLEAVRKLPNGICSLSIAGSSEVDPSYARRLQRQAASLSERVRFLGRVSDAELRKALLDHHVLAVPSSYEGFGIVYLEGMGFGLPAIGATSGAAAEIIVHGENGFLVPPEQAAPLAERLAALAEDRTLLAELGQAARRRFLKHPTWQQTAARVRDYLLSWTTH